MSGSRIGRVGVIAGGPSNERQISLKSGRAVFDALIKSGIDAIFLDVYEDVCDIIKNNPMDVGFIALHGRFGEDGTIQKILEDSGIPYTGSGPEASRLALDKAESKEIFARNGIPTPRHIVFDKGNFVIDRALILGLPLVVKPHMEGSSIGLSVVREKIGLKHAVEKALSYGSKVIVEEHIEGRELTVGILDDKPLPVVEIVPKDRVYDYKAKYTDPDTKYIVPAPIDDASSEKAQSLASRAHASLGCRSFSRTDMIMDRSGRIFVLEVNTIPGMTERSLLPKAACSAGWSFERLCIKFIENALEGASK